MRNILISIIIPLYNQDKYFADCLESILAQKSDNLEIIIVDDGSTDKSISIGEKYSKQEKNIKIIKLNENYGPGYARNFGLDQSNGEYILFLDSDDVFDVFLIKKMIDRIRETNADICICKEFYWSPVHDQLNKIEHELPEDLLPDFDGFNKDNYSKYIFNFCAGWPWDKLFRKDFLLANSIRFPEERNLDGAEDLVFVFDAFARAKKISICDEYLIYHRGHDDSLEKRRNIYTAYSALVALRRRLKDAGLYAQLEQTFHNFALKHLAWHRRHVEGLNKKVPQELYEHWLESLGITDKPESYFHEKNLFLTEISHDFAEYNEINENEEYKSELNISDKLVSVILPFNNGTSWLSDTLGSLINIERNDFEYILIDDRSEDNTLAICEKYAEINKNIHIIKHEKKLGMIACYNEGIRVANGEFVVFLDGDCLYDNEFLPKMTSRILSENADICICGEYEFNRDLNRVEKVKSELSEKNYPKFDGFNCLTYSNYIFNFAPLNPFNRFYRKDFLLENEIDFDEDPGLGEFSKILFCGKTLADAHKIVLEDEFLLTRKNEDSVTLGQDSLHSCYLALSKLKKYLENKELYKLCEQSFINLAFEELGSYVNLNRLKDDRLLTHLYYERWLKNLDIINKHESYFYGRKLYKTEIKKLADIALANGKLHSMPENFEDLTFNDVLTNNLPQTDLISIILPVYNSEKYLINTLDSLKNQTWKNIEILCINDGSTDNSLAILQHYAETDERFKVFSQPNSGPARARNVGLENMSGKYLMFCDSDDWYCPEMCEKMHWLMTENNKFDIGVCKAKCHFDIMNEMAFRTKDYIENHQVLGSMMLNNDNKRSVSVHLWDKIYRTELINKYKIKFPEGYEHDDRSFIMKYLIISSNLFGIDCNLYNHRLRKNSIMDNFYNTNINNPKFDIFHIYLDLIKFINDNNMLTKENITYLLSSLNEESRFFIWKFINSPEDQKKAVVLIKKILNNIPNKYFNNFKFLLMIKLTNYNFGRIMFNDNIISNALINIKRKIFN